MKQIKETNNEIKTKGNTLSFAPVAVAEESTFFSFFSAGLKISFQQVLIFLRFEMHS